MPLSHRLSGIFFVVIGSAAAIGQVNQSIATMDDVTQRNAALVEEAAAAAGALEGQAAGIDPAPPAGGVMLAAPAGA